MCNNQTKVYASTEEKCVEKCMKAVEMLQEINIANQKKIQELSHLYMKAQKYPLFIHQMSLDQYLQKCDLFSKCADVYMQKNFKVQVSRCVMMEGKSFKFIFHTRFSVGRFRWWKWNSGQRYFRNCRRNWRNQRSVSIQYTNIWCFARDEYSRIGNSILHSQSIHGQSCIVHGKDDNIFPNEIGGEFTNP